jgi:hypothetical protein
MIAQGFSIDFLIRLMNLDGRGDDDSWLLFGPEEPAAEEEEPPLKWAAE